MAVSKQDYISRALDAPPSYEESEIRSAESSDSTTSLPSPPLQLQTVHSTFKPIVIPQTSKSFRGAFFSPFSRAYSPDLESHSISTSDFLIFLDGLNEAFIAAPAFQIAGQIGGVMTLVPLPPVRWAGMGLSVASGLISTATSWTRATAYVNAANKDMFLPRGLRCKVLKTQKMMVAVGHGGAKAKLELPPLDRLNQNWAHDRDDPRMRRVRALGDRVAPLTFDSLPPPETPENWWKRVGSKQAEKKDAKMQKKLMKRRKEGLEKYEDKMEKVYEVETERDKEIRKIEKERTKELRKAEKHLGKSKAKDPKERAKIEKDLQHEMRKLDKETAKTIGESERKIGKETRSGEREIQRVDEKEHKVAQKIYWIVIDKAERLEREFGVEEDVDDVEDVEYTAGPEKSG